MQESRYKTFWPRIMASIIDVIILYPIGLIMSFVYKSGLPFTVFVAFILDICTTLAYSIYLHGYYGQTVGKWLMKVRVLSLDETHLSMRQAVLRDSIGIAFNVVLLAYATGPILSGISPDSHEFGRHIPATIFNVAFVVFALEVITMLTNKKRRSLHDYIAGSVVVRCLDTAPDPDSKRSP